MNVRTLWSLILILLLALRTPHADAQEPNPGAPAQVTAESGVSDADAAKVREVLGALNQGELKALAQAMGADVPEDPKPIPVPATTPAQQVDEVTIPIVADRMVGIVDRIVTQVSSTVERVAPKFWEVMVRQQYAKAFGELIWPLGMFMFVLGYWLLARKRVPAMIATWDTKDPNAPANMNTVSWVITHGVPMALMFGFGTIFFWCLSNTVMYLVNPEYYAVRDIITMMLAPQYPPR